jgi:predicted AAA+ superfamily ATPase
VRSFIEKDIVLSAGIQKVQTFARVLALLAARTGTLLNASSISQESGVQASTILDWVGIFERTHLVHRLQPGCRAGASRRLSCEVRRPGPCSRPWCCRKS